MKYSRIQFSISVHIIIYSIKYKNLVIITIATSIINLPQQNIFNNCN